MSVKRSSSLRGTATTARPADSLKRNVNASRPSGTTRRAPFPPRRQLDDRLHETAVGQVVRRVDHAVAGRRDQDLAEQLLPVEVHGRRHAAEVLVGAADQAEPPNSSLVSPSR
ncbi:hypothetical protein STANM309S_00666 [Streptomyces tanashiensis]